MSLLPAFLPLPSNSLQNSQALGFVRYKAKKHVLLSACVLWAAQGVPVWGVGECKCAF